jgi:plasmid stability protein
MIALFAMAQLLVRNLPESLVKKLKRRAVENGVSAEEEHRRILRSFFSPPKRKKAVKANSKKPYTFDDHLLAMPDVGEDWMFDRKDPRNATPPSRRKVDFNDQ